MRIAGNPSLVGRRQSGPSCPPGGGWSAGARAVLGPAAVAALTGFHAWLFWTHAITGRLLDPATALRWVAAALIVAGFVARHRLGRPLTSGRQALVLWLLVALLHGHAAVSARGLPAAAAIPESVSVLIVQIATAAPGVLLGLGLLLLLARRHGARPRARSRIGVLHFACGIPLAGHFFRFAPRPPPDLLPA